MVFETIKRERLVLRAVAQRRPIFSKLGLKGLSDYHSNEIVFKAARWGGQWAEENSYSHGISTQKERAGQQL
jgi:hypothetical protein